jgi:hypothetical protein
MITSVICIPGGYQIKHTYQGFLNAFPRYKLATSADEKADVARTLVHEMVITCDAKCVSTFRYHHIIFILFK